MFRYYQGLITGLVLVWGAVVVAWNLPPDDVTVILAWMTLSLLLTKPLELISPKGERLMPYVARKMIPALVAAVIVYFSLDFWYQVTGWLQPESLGFTP